MCVAHRITTHEMAQLERSEPPSQLLAARLLKPAQQHIRVQVSVDFSDASKRCIPDERYRRIMLEGATQAGFSTAQFSEIDRETTPFTPERTGADCVGFKCQGPQREFTREEVCGRAHFVIFKSKVLYLDCTNSEVMQLREQQLPVMLQHDLWQGRDCTLFLQRQYYNPLYGKPPVPAELSAAYFAWLEDQTSRVSLLGYCQVGTLTAEAMRAPLKLEFPIFDAEVAIASQRGEVPAWKSAL